MTDSETPPTAPPTAPPADLPAALPAALDTATARDIFDGAARRWIAERRERVPGFVDRHFSLSGALRTHRHALGLDLVRAPVNVLASVATVGKKGASLGLRGVGARQAARRLDERSLFLRTRVGREVEWRIVTELLELPARDGDRVFERDSLLEAVMQDPRVEAHLAQVLAAVGSRVDDLGFRERLADAMAEYVGSRAAAADLTATLFATSAGALAWHQFTPGVAALSGAVAGKIAHGAAVGGFWAGPWLGKLYYGLFSATTPPLLYAGVFAGLMLPMAVMTAFAGVVADPVQRRLGLHGRRLGRMLDVVERNLTGETEARYRVRDHYVARVMDVVDWASVVLRVAAR